MNEIAKKNRKAFTLIELVIVMAIISILAAVVTVSLGTQNTKKELETNAREFASVLREAQNYALTGKQPDPPHITCQFSVSWDNTPTSTYRLWSMSRNNGACNIPVDFATYSLKRGVQFSSPTTGTVSFSLPWATTGSSKIVFAKGGFSHTVCLSTSGKITDQAGNIVCL